jgi:hypothetical protein
MGGQPLAQISQHECERTVRISGKAVHGTPANLLEKNEKLQPAPFCRVTAVAPPRIPRAVAITAQQFCSIDM